MSLAGWNAPRDEKDAIMLIGCLVRRIRNGEADDRIKAFAEKAEDWLKRYDAKHPYRMLRDEATIVASKEGRDDG